MTSALGSISEVTCSLLSGPEPVSIRESWDELQVVLLGIGPCQAPAPGDALHASSQQLWAGKLRTKENSGPRRTFFFPEAQG